jgi:hypothetical protein
MPGIAANTRLPCSQIHGLMWIINLPSVEYVVQYWSKTTQLPQSSRVEFHRGILL